MSVQIITIVTGEKLIADVREIYEDDTHTKGIGFSFGNPYVLSIVNDDPIEIRFDRWNPYTIDDVFQVPYDMVVCINEPSPELLNMYNSRSQIPESSSDSYDPILLTS
jgi:hypothetical protein